MKWQIEKIMNFLPSKLWGEGYFQFGFHDRQGNRHVIDADNNRLGRLDKDGESFVWSAGRKPLPRSKAHIPADIQYPVYLGDPGDGTLLVSSYNNSLIYRISPDHLAARVLIDGNRMGLADLHNCVPDTGGNIWIHGAFSHRIWCFDAHGELLHSLGDGQPGFQAGTVSWDDVRFRNAFDLRSAPDGGVYVLDSGNFSVRKVDIASKAVTTVVGTGQPGYTGDGGAAVEATLGGKPGVKFNGPWSLAVDERGDLFIGDTQNGVVRMVDAATGIITTIAGRPDPIAGLRNSPAETDPTKVNLPLICGLDYYEGRLFIPEWDGDAVVLRAEYMD